MREDTEGKGGRAACYAGNQVCQTDGGLGGAGEVGADGAFTVAVRRLSVGMLTHSAASTNMPAHVTHLWKKAGTTHTQQTRLRLRARRWDASSPTRLCP